jgi:hypothetical protein
MSGLEDDDRPFPGLAGLRDVTPPASLVTTVMKRVAEPAPVLAPATLSERLRQAERPEEEPPIPGLAGLREVTPPASMVAAVMKRIAEPAPVPATLWERLRRPPERPAVEQPIAGLAGLREIALPTSLVPAVMRRVAEPAPLTFWSWLRKPRRFELRLSPLNLAGLLGGAAMAVLVVWGMAGRDRSRFVVEVPAAPSNATVVVRFTLVAQGARQVAVAGDFNGWNPEGTVLVNQDGQGNFVGTVRLPPGAHEYMFVVDGKWVTDPAASELRPDGFGRTNAVLRL